MNSWIQKFQNPRFIFEAACKQFMPAPQSSKDMSIPTLLMNRYLTGVSKEHQAIIPLLQKSAQLGYSFDGKCKSGRPVLFHVVQFRIFEDYSDIAFPPVPLAHLSVNLSGYLGTLVKLALQVQQHQLSPKEVEQRRNSPFHLTPVLKKVSKIQRHPSGLPIQDLLNLINRITTAPIHKVDIEKNYSNTVHSKLQPTFRHLIHDAAMNYQSTLLATLLEKGVNPLHQDQFGRNILHIIEMTEDSQSRSVIEGLPQYLLQQLQSAKDNFGRTAPQIRQWKNTRFQADVPAKPNAQNGGWNTEVLSKHEGTSQSIDIVDASKMDFKQLATQYLSCLKPVLIRNGQNMAALQKKWTRKAFYERFGGLEIEVGSIPYASTYGLQSSKKSIATHIPSLKEYGFCQISPKTHAPIFEDIQQVDIVNKLLGTQAQLYQGIAGSGAPMHLHTDAWNALFYGRKKWFILPPTKGFYSTQTPLQWLNSGNIPPNTIEFVQEAGDIVYIPRHWSHAVLNLQECVGVAMEFVHPYVG